MRALRRIALGLTAIALLVGFRGDRARRSGSVTASRSVADAPPGTASLPRFALFGWVSPPREFATAERYAELAEAGFDVTVLAWQDSGTVADNQDRLSFTRSHGVRNLILDQRFDRMIHDMPSTYSIVDSIIATYPDDPALLGYDLGDEPTADRFEWLARAFALLRALDPAHPAWNNLFGMNPFATRDGWRRYVRAYAETVDPSVLCADQYDFLTDRDLGFLIPTASELGALARERGIPFWGIVQLTQHLSFRAITPGLLRWQVAQWLAHGARGIGHFTYWTPAPDSAFNWHAGMIEWGTGARSPHFEHVSALNRQLRPVGETLAGATWLAAEYSGTVPDGGTAFAPDELLGQVSGRLALGWFADSTGAPLLLVANQDSAVARTATLRFAGERDVWSIDSVYRWNVLPSNRVGAGTQVMLELVAGGFVLLRLSGDLTGLGTGTSGPLLRATPQPAREVVRFDATGLAGDSRLELLDLSGRRVWGTRLSTAATSVAWRGERDAGGRAAPGVRLARLEDARGVSVRRVHWLGGR